MTTRRLLGHPPTDNPTDSPFYDYKYEFICRVDNTIIKCMHMASPSISVELWRPKAACILMLNVLDHPVSIILAIGVVCLGLTAQHIDLPASTCIVPPTEDEGLSTTRSGDGSNKSTKRSISKKLGRMFQRSKSGAAQSAECTSPVAGATFRVTHQQHTSPPCTSPQHHRVAQRHPRLPPPRHPHEANRHPHP